MTPIQYRDAESDVLLECGVEEEVPRIGQRVIIGLHEYRVLYRWRCGPGAPAVYVRKVADETRHPIAA
jgi:hypothetical protein